MFRNRVSSFPRRSADVFEAVADHLGDGLSGPFKSLGRRGFYSSDYTLFRTTLAK